MTDLQKWVLEEEDSVENMFTSFADELTPLMAARLCGLSYHDANEIKETLDKIELYQRFNYLEG